MEEDDGESDVDIEDDLSSAHSQPSALESMTDGSDYLVFEMNLALKACGRYI